MNKCKKCNKRIWLSKNWCMNCLEKIVDEIVSKDDNHG
ncbi:hypothetical protein SIXOD_v1c26170 [Spiroplasma ixodetis Y32]|nr:hypothetical protein SIXOD_v1c01820 [Spiroplasma ixodetis Y32]WJG70007.1 hypothetical protein SIXOD_v1c10340 [Spiroplasma ixodetis Y32]WJG70220.1 hypothetical protein SIXOD_v1c13030 [Spiroplasma ixodetis Y32]WJG70665.1 hypothetical protein SIXOD_v1c18720 [Spiroplasma ixodetis Y32]WJG71240.1 hypothetical protein SIXOD_v1c26170 [Spiroplasma ixodetis Y32]